MAFREETWREGRVRTSEISKTQQILGCNCNLETFIFIFKNLLVRIRMNNKRYKRNTRNK